MMNLLGNVVTTSVIFLVFCVCSFPCQKVEGDVYPNQGICDSRDVRNKPAALKALRNCTIIVGSLQIVLIEGVTENAFAGYSFPELREVTHFVLLYRVEGITSLGQLFPNLALIRGRELFFNYALVIYELPQLQEVGLKSLTNILRGGVRMEKNPQLCYTQTVSWKNITERAGGNYFNGNGLDLCPGSDTCRGCEENLCWSSRNCQRFPSPSCDPQCLGGCTPIGGLCYRCRNFMDGNMCVPSCPADKFEFAPAGLCVKKELCRTLYGKKGWTWEGKCLRRCPKGYDEVVVKKTRSCVPCDKCSYVCQGDIITSLADAQHFRGCNTINGSLEIKLTGEHAEDVMREMEENLGDIEEITGYLKVFRSISLTSLRFFKNLTVIHGTELEYSRYSLVVYEMNNLQYLWNWSERPKLSLKNGTVFFHYNAKLCLKVIDELKEMTNVTTTDYDVSNGSNGYKTTCQLVVLETESLVIDQTNVTISWDRFTPNATSPLRPSANATIQGYLLFYLENPEGDVAPDFGRDSCFEHEWSSTFIPETKVDEGSSKRLSLNLTGLKPSTRYAFYVETYDGTKGSYVATDTTSKHGQSIVKYFTTQMDTPSMPFDFRAVSNAEDTISIFWEVDPEYKGTITRYLIQMLIQFDDQTFLDNRNYCLNPLNFSPTSKNNNTAENETKSLDKDGECHCGPGKLDRFWETLVVDKRPHFEIFPKNIGPSVVCKNSTEPSERISDLLEERRCNLLNYKVIEFDESDTNPHERSERHADHFKVPKEFAGKPTPRPVKNVTVNEHYHFYSAEFAPHHKNYTVYNLIHHTKYIMLLSACTGKRIQDCGPTATAAQRTMKNVTADDILEASSTVLNNSTVEIFWKEPKKPNGVVLSYTVEYKRTDIMNFKPVFECVTRVQHETNKFTYSLHHLHPGPYSVRVRATSLAGDGNYTDYHYFVIPVTNYGFNWPLFFGLGVACALSIAGSGYYYHKRYSGCATDQRVLVGSEYAARYSEEPGGERVDLIELSSS